MNKILKLFFLFLIFFISKPLFAAEISIEKILPSISDLKVGDEVLLNVVMDSEEVVYNALEGDMVFPENIEIEKVITGNSFISVWIENPVNFSKNKIRFSGISPSGYNSTKGNIFSVVLKVVNKGDATIKIENAKVFQNDGLGTQNVPKLKNLNIKTRYIKNGEEPYLVSVKDSTPPEDFKIELIKDKNIFDGLYTLVFSTLDKGSGVKYYDVIEGHNVFKQVQSPYVLKNQSLNEKIYVKAVDFEGNERIAVFKPENKICIGTSCYGYVWLIVFILFMSSSVYILWKKKKRLFRK